MSDLLDNIDEMQIDVFRELGNIGAGNAATALASMLNKRIDMKVPDVQIVPFNEIVNILSSPEKLVAGILVNISGGLNGYILMVLDVKDALEMAGFAMGEERSVPEDPSESDFSEMDKSALAEIVNTLVGAYLTAIGSMTGLVILQDVPQMAIDMVGAILSIVAIEYGQIGDSVLFLKTQFTDVEKDINGHFFIIPDFESYKILLKSLGIEI